MEMEFQEIKKTKKRAILKIIQIEPNDRNLLPFGIKPRKMKKTFLNQLSSRRTAQVPDLRIFFTSRIVKIPTRKNIYKAAEPTGKKVPSILGQIGWRAPT